MLINKNMKNLLDIKKALRKYKKSGQAKILQRFFKTGPGEYGEGDIFLGLKVQEIRDVSKKYQESSFSDLKKLLSSKVHEERSVAIMILNYQFQEADTKKRGEIYNFYLKNLSGINNWDLVDSSAHKIIGEYLRVSKTSRKILYKLSKSKNLWERRLSIISTFQFIKNGEFKETLKIAKILLKDKEDLIHKATGWMLREVGKRNLLIEEEFLKKHYKTMPRTMLRYAIERIPEKRRQAYLKGKI